MLATAVWSSLPPFSAPRNHTIAEVLPPFTPTPAEKRSLDSLRTGITALRKGNTSTAIEALTAAIPGSGELSDYARYNLAQAQFRQGLYSAAAGTLEDFRENDRESPLFAGAMKLEIEALLRLEKFDEAEETLQLSTRLFDAPDRLWLTGRIFEASGDDIGAAAEYRKLYYAYPVSPLARSAKTALDTLVKRSDVRLSPPTAEQYAARANALFDARRYSEAQQEYRRVAAGTALREYAAVRIAACSFRMGKVSAAQSALSRLNPSGDVGKAERLYYLAEIARARGDIGGFQSNVALLQKQYPKSPSTQLALLSAAQLFQAKNQRPEFTAYYRALAGNFPDGSYGELAHWNVAWTACVNDDPAARSLFQRHLDKYPEGDHYPAALFWLGVLAKREGDIGGAAETLTRVIHSFPNHFYGQQAAEVLKDIAPGKARAAIQSVDAIPEADPVPSPKMARTLHRARLLASSGLPDLGDSELLTVPPGAKGAFWVGLEFAERAAEDNDHQQAMRYLKKYGGNYTSRPLSARPRRFWELLYPLPWSDKLKQEADRYGVDVNLVAGLIRQESEFNPRAKSYVGARGLMQLMPPTAKEVSRKIGLARLNLGQLHIPDVNVRLGVAFLSQLLGQFDGKPEAAIASYNAGASRGKAWLSQRSYENAAAFMECIPFAETRNYVAAVIGNRGMYQKIYGR